MHTSRGPKAIIEDLLEKQEKEIKDFITTQTTVMDRKDATLPSSPPREGEDVHVFVGVFLYQAYNDEIADYAIQHQRFGGPAFKPRRMTWIKPSFAWVLYRSGYASKHNQQRVLKIKLSHEALGKLLASCKCKEGGGGSKGRVQWDPARDLFAGEAKEPRKLRRRRAIQIGIKEELSELYVNSTISIEDVSGLAKRVGLAHLQKNKAKSEECVAALAPDLPRERPYMPLCDDATLISLRLKTFVADGSYATKS